MPTTAQQINTLLHCLTHQQTPPFAVLFWSNLQKIDFDYSQNSLHKLSQLFVAMSTRHVQIADLLTKEGGQAFVIAVAAYIADYLAKTTGQSIQWLDYAAMTQEVARHPTYLQQSASFEYSLTAKIGEKVYCQPLKLLPSLLAGEAVLPQFIAKMSQTLYEQSQVNLLQSADKVCHDFLAKVKTGKLFDPSIGFAAYLANVNFDYSYTSLAQIDTALAAIAQDFAFKRDDYLGFVQDPTRQAFCYLLGFYIGVTSSRLANVAVRWVSFEQMYDSLGDTFAECVEHSFVLLLEDCYRTPMLVVTNRLFGLANKFVTLATEFADRLQAQHTGHITVYPYERQTKVQTATLPIAWQQAMQAAARIVHSKLGAIVQGQSILPGLYQVQLANQNVDISAIKPLVDTDADTDTDTDKAIDTLYQLLQQNPQLSTVMVGCFDSYTNLPMGRTQGIVIEVRVYEPPTLQLQLILPYQSATDTQGLRIYPLVSHEKFVQSETALTIEQLTALTQLFYQACINAQTLDEASVHIVWQEAFVNELDFWALSPKDALIKTQQQQWVTEFDFPLLPVVDNGVNALSASQFDYTTIDWRGFDLAKQLLQLPDAEQSYLQVFASDKLIQDELYRQAEATANLYRYGKVVWGVVLDCDEPLTQPLPEDERDKPFANYPLYRADVLFDPSGQASVAALQSKADALLQAIHALSQQANASHDLMFYQLHLHDAKSRVFNLPYPQSVAAINYRISSSWIWRRHLPNGMLSDRIVPIIINPHNHGEIMLLPSKFWDKTYYHYWLSLAYQHFGQDYDLLPFIHWQQKYGQNEVDAATQKRLFPKTKASRLTSQNPVTHTQKTALEANQLNLTLPPLKQPQSLPQPSANITTDLSTTVSQKSSVQPVIEVADIATHRPVQTPETVSQPSVSNDLMQQLINDKLRLQTQLSTQDKAKEKKLFAICAAVMLVVIIAIWLIKWMR